MRCFIALPLPQGAALALASLAQELAARWPRLGWVRDDSYHVTLAFLGDLDDAGRECAAEALQGLSEPAITFRFSGLGGFPPAGPWRVLYASLDDRPGGRHTLDDRGTADRLHRSVNQALRKLEHARGLPALNAEWKDDGSGRPFAAHVTLARIAEHRHGHLSPAAEDRHSDRPRPLDLVHMTKGIETKLEGQWTINRCVLYKSELTRGPAVYTELNQTVLGQA